MTEADRLSACLDRLVPHLDMKGIAVTGGVAIQLGLAALGREGLRHQIADLDFVAGSTAAVMPSVVEQFLVSHYHVERPGVPKFMIQLVDPLSRIRIDVFPDLVGSLGDANPIVIGSHAIRVLPLERVFEHKVHMLSRATVSAPIDPKHVRDAHMLGDVLGMKIPEVVTQVLAPDVYGIDDDRFCDRCDLSQHPRWPLAPKNRVFELLGWNRPGAGHEN